MCGIAGIFQVEPKMDFSPEVEERLIQSIKHRGPDGQGTYTDNQKVLFVHTRLSIIDLSEAGTQPMHSHTGRYTCIFNGELYNYQTVRKRLITRGYRFHGHSDAEIIPALLEEYGLGFVEHLNGIFAIAIYDQKESKVILCRDHFGVKPLYYCVEDETFFFGSELKAITCNPEVKKIPDLQAIYDYFGLSVIPEPQTGFQGINALEPGHLLLFSSAGIQKKEFWSIDNLTPKSIAYNEAKDHTEQLIRQAVDSQTIADVSLGAFLSGGVDSSLVVTQLSQTKKNFPTFNVRFSDKQFDESPFARQVAKINNTDHKELYVAQGSGSIDFIEKILGHFDQPYADTSCFPTYLVTREMRKHVKVALSGDGGDEVFCGYNTFWFHSLIRKSMGWPNAVPGFFNLALPLIKKISPGKSRQLNKVLQIRKQSNAQIVSDLLCYLSDDLRKKLLNRDLFENNQVHPSSRLYKAFDDIGSKSDEKNVLELSKALLNITLPSDMLKKVDMMSMLNGLEVRVPLLDKDLVEFALSLPSEYKFQGRTKTKVILKDILKKYLPASVVDREKWGFAIPLESWAGRNLTNYLNELLLSETSRTIHVFGRKQTQAWFNGFLGKINLDHEVERINLNQRIFMLASLELWLRNHEMSF